jgi:integrase
MGARSSGGWDRPGPGGVAHRRVTSPSAWRRMSYRQFSIGRDGERCRGWCGRERRSRRRPRSGFGTWSRTGDGSPQRFAVICSALEAHLLPAFGSMLLEGVTTAVIERWLVAVDGSQRTKAKLLIELHGIFGRGRKAYGLRENPVDDVEKFSGKASGEIQVFSPEEVWALVRAASGEQDAAIFLTAAFTGLRMGELLALRWRDVDFERETIRVRASYYLGHLSTPKSGKVRGRATGA